MCCSSAPGCSRHSTISGAWTSALIEVLRLVPGEPAVEPVPTKAFQPVVSGDAGPTRHHWRRSRCRPVQSGAAVGQRELDEHFHPGRRTSRGSSKDGINRLVVSPNFFQMMGMPMLLGRGFTDAENNATAPKVVVINDAAAQVLPQREPNGQQIGSSVETSNQLEVVGVLRDAKYNSVRDAAPATMKCRTCRRGLLLRPRRSHRGRPLGSVGAIREAMRQESIRTCRPPTCPHRWSRWSGGSSRKRPSRRRTRCSVCCRWSWRRLRL